MTWDPRRQPTAAPQPGAPQTQGGGWMQNNPWLQGLAQRVQQARSQTPQWGQRGAQPQGAPAWGQGGPQQGVPPQPPGPAVGGMQNGPPQWGGPMLGNLAATAAQRQQTSPVGMAPQGGMPMQSPMQAPPPQRFAAQREPDADDQNPGRAY